MGGHPVNVKAGGGRVKAEFDDVAKVSAETGLSVTEVASGPNRRGGSSPTPARRPGPAGPASCTPGRERARLRGPMG